MPLEFPFAEVDDAAVVFGGIPNYEEVLSACPDNFRQENEYSRIAKIWFHRGLNPHEDLAGYELTAETREDAIGQRRYIETWLGSFKPRHEDKIAVGGWLLSIMLRPEQAEAEGTVMAAKIRDQIDERRAKIELLHGDNIFSQYAAQFPELRDATIRLYEEEVEAFSALDPTTATDQDILGIINTYHLLREELAPNISSYNQSDEDGQP